MITRKWFPARGGNVITDGNGIILDSNQGYTGGFLVTGNIVHDNGGVGIQTFHSDNATISNNAIWHNNLGHVQSDAKSDIFNNQSSNVTITGNTGDPGDSPPPPPPSTPINGTSGKTIWSALGRRQSGRHRGQRHHQRTFRQRPHRWRGWSPTF